ncbi:L-fuculose-phosphate aldolase [Acidiphilium sp. MT5]
MDDFTARLALIEACQRLNPLGINQGNAGNISLRAGDAMLISPSSIPYDQLRPELIAQMSLDPDQPAITTPDDPTDIWTSPWTGPCKPSSEWRFHRDILRARPEITAIVHTHAIFATTLAIAHRPIEACHYMIACFGGHDVRCAPYATFGTQALSDHALAALEGRTACLLANHGMIALGETLERALWRAVELETISKQYIHALMLGQPHILSRADINDALAQFATYGHASPLAKTATSR